MEGQTEKRVWRRRREEDGLEYGFLIVTHIPPMRDFYLT